MQTAAYWLGLCFVASAAQAQADQPPAPLPDGVAPSAAVRVPGLYAESEAFSRIDVNERLEALVETCKARGTELKVEARDLLNKGKRQIFRTQKMLAVYEFTPRIEADDKSCTAHISLARTVTVGAWDKNKAADWLDRRPKCERINMCRSETVAGVQAMCARDSGDSFVGTSVCYSQQKDLSEDLVVARSIYSDDGSGPNGSWSLSKVLVNVLIDPAVFRMRP